MKSRLFKSLLILALMAASTPSHAQGIDQKAAAERARRANQGRVIKSPQQRQQEIYANLDRQSQQETAKCLAGSEKVRAQLDTINPRITEKAIELSNGFFNYNGKRLFVLLPDDVLEIKSIDNKDIPHKLEVYFEKTIIQNSPANIANNGLVEEFYIKTRLNLYTSSETQYIRRYHGKGEDSETSSWFDGVNGSNQGNGIDSPCLRWKNIKQSYPIMNFRIGRRANGDFELMYTDENLQRIFKNLVFNFNGGNDIFSSGLLCPYQIDQFKRGDCKLGWYLSPNRKPDVNSSINSASAIQFRGKGYLGTTSAIADEMQYRRAPDGSEKQVRIRGERVLSVAPGSPADKAGIRVGDIVETIATRYRSEQTLGFGLGSLAQIISEIDAGYTVRLGVVRGWKDLKIDVQLDNLP